MKENKRVNKDLKIQIRVTPGEKMLIQAKAKKLGLPISQLLVKSALGQRVDFRVFDERMKNLLREISAIGNNVNQIAKQFNEQKHAELFKALEIRTKLLTLIEKYTSDDSENEDTE